VVVERTQEELDAALAKGARPFLPDNETPGWLGERGADMRKVDDFKPSLNAGLLQEETPQTRWLFMLVLYLLVITFPAALWILWREPRRSKLSKIVTTVVGVLGYVALYFLFRNVPAA
jgi:hypothetical protein